jgi:L-cysteine:1D-myo-inositol 2-amino-2-deoxy-alpha-D-glucopyranoside ligase
VAVIAWAGPLVPQLPGSGLPPQLHDTATGTRVGLTPGEDATLYVCGITPYDATHLGHAATYLTFDLLVRAWRDAGRRVRYAQNITDIDDPLLERADRDGLAWQDLAATEIQLFRDDMAALRVVPPDRYVGVVESMAAIESAVADLDRSGAAYRLPHGDGADLYLDLARQDSFGRVCRWSRAQMLAVFADRGGDPDRAGKRDPLDPLVWRAARPGEPSWPSASLGPGRPGWHIECTSIARDHVGVPFDVQGGGTDLIFPHHEMSAVQSAAWTGATPFARAYVHQAMVGLGGAKMSKSQGNLVLVSALLADGVDPMAIRLALLGHHHRTPWEWTDDDLVAAQRRLRAWREAARPGEGRIDAEALLRAVRGCLADDLDAPGALRAVDICLTGGHPNGLEPVGRRLTLDTLDALLGVRL